VSVNTPVHPGARQPVPGGSSRRAASWSKAGR